MRPREFERRLVQPLTPGVITLAMALLRSPGGVTPGGWFGLRVLRRLTGFHSVVGVVRPDPGDGAVMCAVFVSPDRVSVANSLAILHELEDSGALFTSDKQLFGLAAHAA